MKRSLPLILSLIAFLVLTGQSLGPVSDSTDSTDSYLLPATDSIAEEAFQVYTFAIMDNIAAPTWRITQEAMEEAISLGADAVILHMNTYGGEVSAADSIRTKLLNAPMPVYVFIDDNAASAGALIAISCHSIYMKPGGKIGAATVVNQTGEQVPDKYQSYMRATMRATAEAHGKDTIINGTDTTLVWHRDPAIAEAMVDPKLYVEGVSDTGQVLTFTASEAMLHGYCEGTADNIEEVITSLGIKEYELSSYSPSGVDKVIGFLINPMVSGVLIMIIVGGIYFELQSPGIGFALAASIVAALLYFAPLYIEGMAENWELIIFFAGIVLIMVEVFAIPGFGVAGVAGVIAVVLGLTLSLVDNIVFSEPEFTGEGLGILMRALSVVLVSTLLGLVFSLWATQKVLTSTTLGNLSLRSEQKREEGYVAVEIKQEALVGSGGVAHTVLRPSGRVMIEGQIYDAISELSFIEKGEEVVVTRYESGQVYVSKKTS